VTQQPSSRAAQWQKPRLIVVSQGRPEEAVLASCKGDEGTYIFGESDIFTYCAWPGTCGGMCSAIGNS